MHSRHIHQPGLIKYVDEFTATKAMFGSPCIYLAPDARYLVWGEDDSPFQGRATKAMRYVVKVEIGGVAGTVAPLVEKQPKDTQEWILDGEAPAFLRSQGSTHQGSPVWIIELTSPVRLSQSSAGH